MVYTDRFESHDALIKTLLFQKWERLEGETWGQS